MSEMTASDHVAAARAAKRPRASQFIDKLFTDVIEFHGDRLFGDDLSIMGGIGRFQGQPVTILAQRKGHNTKENLKYNFGMPNPEGYRKVQRLARQAERFNRPIITLIDTPGAYPGIEAEQRGQGEAIAACIAQFSSLNVPIIAVIIGEGGSGGALALGVANRVIMLENAVYSILSPEGFATILWKDNSRASEAAELMGITAEELKAVGVADHIVPELEGGPEVWDQVYYSLSSLISEELDRMNDMTGPELVAERFEKFRAYGDCRY